jgi:hypothetical protein
MRCVFDVVSYLLGCKNEVGFRQKCGQEVFDLNFRFYFDVKVKTQEGSDVKSNPFTYREIADFLMLRVVGRPFHQDMLDTF